MKKVSTKQITLAGILSAICIVMSLTPLGYVPVGPLPIGIGCRPGAVLHRELVSSGDGIGKPHEHRMGSVP